MTNQRNDRTQTGEFVQLSNSMRRIMVADVHFWHTVVTREHGFDTPYQSSVLEAHSEV